MGMFLVDNHIRSSRAAYDNEKQMTRNNTFCKEDTLAGSTLSEVNLSGCSEPPRCHGTCPSELGHDHSQNLIRIYKSLIILY